MKMYQFEKDFDFHALGREIKRKRKNKGWTQEYLAQLLDRTPRSIMYMENRGQHPSLNILFKIATLLEISIDQFFFPAQCDMENERRKSRSWSWTRIFSTNSLSMVAAMVSKSW